MPPAVSRLLRAAFGVALFTALVWAVGPSRLLQTLRDARPSGVALGALAYALVVGVKTVRWLRVLRIQGLSLAPREALRAYGLGMLLGAVTPGRVGQHVKALALVRKGATWPRALAGTLVDQLLDMVVVALLLPLAVGYFGASISGSLVWGAVSLALATAVLLAVAWFTRERFGAAAREAWHLGRRSLGAPLALAVCSSLLYFATLGLVGSAVGIRTGVVPIALASVASGVVEMAPVTVAGLGTREAALLVLLRPLGVDPPHVLALTLLVRAFQVAAGALAYAAGSGSFRATAAEIEQARTQAAG